MGGGTRFSCVALLSQDRQHLVGSQDSSGWRRDEALGGAVLPYVGRSQSVRTKRANKTHSQITEGTGGSAEPKVLLQKSSEHPPRDAQGRWDTTRVSNPRVARDVPKAVGGPLAGLLCGVLPHIEPRARAARPRPRSPLSCVSRAALEQTGFQVSGPSCRQDREEVTGHGAQWRWHVREGTRVARAWAIPLCATLLGSG